MRTFSLLFHLANLLRVRAIGMIDSATEGADRGYDFIQAVRWFSERADFVLIFFDPDKVYICVCVWTMQVFFLSLSRFFLSVCFPVNLLGNIA